MANIDSQISKIRSAERGEDVRDSIISALRDINNDVPADMSNPIQITGTMPAGTDLTIPINPPALVSQVYIKQAGSGGKNTTLVDAKIVENGKYPSEDKDDGGSSYDPDKEIRYYKSVDVNVPQLANKVIDLEEEITQNGTYSAPADWGADGLRTFTVNVSSTPVSGQFEVKFYDSDNVTLLETQLVPAYGSAEFSGNYPTSPLGPFTGWNPSPVNVTKDMKCYPKFGQIIVDPTEITDGWDVICANRGVGYPLGSHKILAYGATFTADEVKTWYSGYSGGDLAFNAYMMMYKVAEGEGNSHSSWLSCAINVSSLPGIWQSGKPGWAAQEQNHLGLREFLNGAFYNHCNQIFKNAIVPVTKYSRTSQGIAYPTEDRIWIAGTSEIGTYQTKAEGNDYYDFTKSTSWSGNYVNYINLLDSSSKKYIRDYLNNNREYSRVLGLDYQHTYVGKVVLRDHISGDVICVYRSPGNTTDFIGYDEDFPQNFINVGFCL